MLSHSVYFIQLHWALCNEIRAHIGTTFVFQGETDFVEGASRVDHSASKEFDRQRELLLPAICQSV